MTAPFPFRLSVALAAALFLGACGRDVPTDPLAEPETQGATALQSGAGELVVMTRNMYLGASFDALIGETDPFIVPIRGWQVWQNVLATRASQRIRAMASEIAALRPDIVGVQEAVLWRTQMPADNYPGGENEPATAVAVDFLQELLDSLRVLGAEYEVAAVVTNLDTEAITVPPPAVAGLPVDVRFTDRDAILVRKGVAYREPRGAQYNARQFLAIGGVPLAVPRGWTSVDVRYHDEWVRVVNTHLEIESFASVQEAQGEELLALLADVTAPTIVLGDLNSRADGAGTATYRHFLVSGFADNWSSKHDGFTCCQLELLDNVESVADQRIDFVLTRGSFAVADMYLVGFGRSDRTVSGLWPSDHAGVVGRIRMTPREPSSVP